MNLSTTIPLPELTVPNMPYYRDPAHPERAVNWLAGETAKATKEAATGAAQVLTTALAALVLFLFWASLFAIGSLGVRLACVLLYRVSPAATSPQALLLVAVLMQLVGFMLCLQLPALLPQYATFGAQTVAAAGGTRQPCALHSPAAIDGRCHSTYMVRMTHHVYSGIPALAVLFQFVNWAFVAACARWLARCVCTRARSRRRRQHDGRGRPDSCSS